MKKPEHTRPFNLEHARAGAPYGCEDGCTALIFKFAESRLFGTIIGDEEFPASWTPEGVKNSGVVIGAEKTLVMLPLGMIDGKPVFVGDEFEMLNTARNGWLKFTATPKDRPSSNDLRWPLPAKAYPVTQMPHAEMFDVYSAHLKSLGYVSVQAETSGLAAVINAAMIHAIEAGQVVPVSIAKPRLRPHDPYTGRLRDPRDVESDPMGVLIQHPDELMDWANSEPEHLIGIVNVGHIHGSKKAIDYVSNAMLDFDPERRTQRDVEIASAVRAWYEQTFPYVAQARTKPDFKAIIYEVAATFDAIHS